MTDCVEAPLARSWPDLVFSAPLRGSGVAIVMGLWFRVFVVLKPAPSGDAIEIAVSGPVSTATVAGCGGHFYEIDATTLSPECQQPSHQSVKNPVVRVSEEQPGGRYSLRCNALRSFAD